jgi:RNA polymerase sigma factor (sigma-70 family)
MIALGSMDEQLAAAVCRGDAAAARALYERHGATVLRFALAMTRTHATAEDIVHDTFLHYLSRPERYDGERGPLIAYLLGIARILVRRSLRDGLSERTGPIAEEGADLVEEHAVRRELVDRVRAAVLALPMQHREIITLCDLQELPYATVAEVLDCPLGTIRSRLHRARALLAARLSAETSALEER